jgi:hypothetical protein
MSLYGGAHAEIIGSLAYLVGSVRVSGGVTGFFLNLATICPVKRLRNVLQHHIAL